MGCRASTPARIACCQRPDSGLCGKKTSFLSPADFAFFVVGRQIGRDGDLTDGSKGIKNLPVVTDDENFHAIGHPLFANGTGNHIAHPGPVGMTAQHAAQLAIHPQNG